MLEYRFQNPAAFQFLWLLPLLLAFAWYLSRSQLKKIHRALGQRLTPFLTASLSQPRRRLKLWLELAVLVFFIFALARPQSGESKKKVKSEGVEIMLVVDVSNSMLAEDSRPSRLELAKKELSRLMDMMDGDRVGLIAFAGSAILLSPLTPDRAATKMYIDSLAPESVSTQGTEFRKALQEAATALVRGGVEETADSIVTKVIVIASDGEDNEPGALDAAKELVDKGVRVFTLGFGTEKGGPIPVRDERGNLRGYKKDRSGQAVISTTKGTILKSLAAEGRGSFHHVTFGGNAVSQLYDEIKNLERSQFETSEVTDYDENYQWILFLGLVLAGLELVLRERRSVGRIWRGRFEVSKR
jgi:Ca-activated chloride channel family protein